MLTVSSRIMAQGHISQTAVFRRNRKSPKHALSSGYVSRMFEHNTKMRELMVHEKIFRTFHHGYNWRLGDNRAVRLHDCGANFGLRLRWTSLRLVCAACLWNFGFPTHSHDNDCRRDRGQCGVRVSESSVDEFGGWAGEIVNRILYNQVKFQLKSLALMFYELSRSHPGGIQIFQSIKIDRNFIITVFCEFWLSHFQAISAIVTYLTLMIEASTADQKNWQPSLNRTGE